MAQINKPDLYFNTKLYTGNGSSQSITGVGFQPDLLWIKSRGGIGNHFLSDVIRGSTKRLKSNETDAEDTITSLSSFDSDGFTLSNTGYNGSGETFASWNWLANGAGVANTDGSISSTVSANTTSGFSIVKWSGNETAGASVGHGLGVAPDLIIKKRTDSSTGVWYTYNKVLGNNKSIYLNLTNAVATSGAWNNQTPTNTVFYNGSSNVENGGTMISYCFASVQGFSKFGSYTGNGNADGTFVYTGFKPAFVMVKENSISSWEILDSKRNTFNPTAKSIFPDGAGAEYDYTNRLDLLSNGFKLRTTSLNGSGTQSIYMAFAEQPLVGTNNIPATAR